MYRRRNKLKPEDWTEEIEKWEKYYMNDKYQIEKRRTSYEYEMREREAQERRMAAGMIFMWKKMKEKK